LPCSVGVGDPAKGNVDLLYINIVEVVRAAVPIKRLFRFLALFAGNVLDEIKVTWWTAAIFGRASAFTSQKSGPRCRFGATQLVGELPRSNGQTTAWPAAPSRALRVIDKVNAGPGNQ
jgi:hypothetical protein